MRRDRCKSTPIFHIQNSTAALTALFAHGQQASAEYLSAVISVMQERGTQHWPGQVDLEQLALPAVSISLFVRNSSAEMG